MAKSHINTRRRVKNAPTQSNVTIACKYKVISKKGTTEIRIKFAKASDDVQSERSEREAEIAYHRSASERSA